MNLKSKVIGVLSAVALSATLGLGVASAETQTTSVGAELVTPDGVCTVTGVTSSGVLGTYTWNGTAYELTSGGTGTLSGTLNSTGYTGDRSCDVSVVAGDMKLGSAVAFPSQSIQFLYGSTPLGNGSAGGTIPNVPTGGMAGTVNVKLLGVPSSAVGAGTYTSTLTITTSNPNV